MDLYLELYRDKIPDEFAGLPGADAFDPGEDGTYWAVLTTTPPAGSDTAALLAPAGPSGVVQATTRGTDTIPAGTTDFVVQQACVWNPKEPPYRFAVQASDGTEIELDPPGSEDEQGWHCQETPASNLIGIWRVKVETLAAQALPAAFGSTQAHLNPDELDFDAATFERQPLLRVIGEPRRDRRDCPTLDGLEVTDGCAPGVVTFLATGENLDAADQVDWNFDEVGEDQFAVGGTLVPGGIEITHEYLSDGGEDGFTAIVTVVLPDDCVDPGGPSTLTASVDVPRCEPPGCPETLTLEIVSDEDCAPGEITFRATTENNLAVELWTWNFDDDGDEVGEAENTHTFEGPGPFTVTVAALLPATCDPRILTAYVDVPSCPEPPPPPPPLRCPSLSGIEVNGCTPGTVTFTAIGENLDQPLEYQWGFGDGTGVNDGPTVSHTYSDGQPRTVAVTIRRPPGCPGPNPRIEAQVQPCEPPRCPTLSGIEVDGCTPGQVTFVAAGANLDQAEGFTWEFGDGTTAEDGPTTTHVYTDNQSHTVSVTARLPAGCPGPDPETTAQVGPCQVPIRIDWCFIFLIVMLGLFVLAAILCLVAGCIWTDPPTPAFLDAVILAAIFLGLALLIYIIWMIVCAGQNGRCDLLQILVYVLRFLVGASIVVAAILALLQAWGCAAGAAIDVGWLAILLLVTETWAEALGCATWPRGDQAP